MCLSLKDCYQRIRQRWVFAFMCFIGLFHTYTTRTCLPITLTEMVLPTNISTSDTQNVNDNTCHSSTGNISIDYTNNSQRQFHPWNEETQGLILSSYYWIYVLSHLPGGIIAEKYGGKHTMGFGILISSIFTLLTPLSIEQFGAIGLIIVRVIIGLGHGVIFPAINVLLSQWAPPSERSRMSGFVYAAISLGTVCANTASGLIIDRTGHISNVFYIFGGLSLIWYIFWLLLCYNSPFVHPFITQLELDYFRERLTDRNQEKLPAIPWKHILYSKAMWAATLSMSGFDWISLTVAADLPKYLSSVLKVPIKENGYMNSLVFLSMWIGSSVTSWLADYVIKRRYLSTTSVRRIGSVLTLFCSACFIVAASYAGCDRILVTIMFTMSIGLTGAALPSIMINPLDISPNYSGTITALTNGISTAFSGIFSPYIIGIMTPNQTINEWRVMFWMIFAIATFSNVFFLMFGKGRPEYWDDPLFRQKRDKKKSIELASEACARRNLECIKEDTS